MYKGSASIVGSALFICSAIAKKNPLLEGRGVGDGSFFLQRDCTAGASISTSTALCALLGVN